MGNAELTVGSDHANPNRLALAIRVAGNRTYKKRRVKTKQSLPRHSRTESGPWNNFKAFEGEDWLFCYPKRRLNNDLWISRESC